MKIGFILPGIPGVPTGGSKVVFEYCNWLAVHGHEIIIYYLHDNWKKNALTNLVWKESLRFKARFIEPKWFKLNNKIKTLVIFSQSDFNCLCQVDVIIATALETTKYVYNLKNLFFAQSFENWATNKAYFIQGHEVWGATEEAVNDSYNYGFKNIVVAKWLEELVEVHSKKKVYLVSNCVDVGVFYDRENVRVNHSIVFHYRKAVHKGCEYALKVVKLLFEKYDDLKVYIVSNEQEHPEIPDCCTFYYNLKAEKIAELNNKAQIFMCTTIEEGFGLPGLEGMACGCALVSSEYKGVLEYAVDGENALLSPIRDVDLMVKNVIRLFEEPMLRERIVKAGIETGKKRSLENSARKFESILIK